MNNYGYYPIFLDINDKDCLVVGGGKVAERKIIGLLEAGARVTVISSRLSENVVKLSKKRQNSKKITIIRSNFAKNRLKESKTVYSLIISATNSSKTNELVYKEASELAIPVNVVDKPSLCSFILPARVKRGDFQLAISTGGKSPYLAKTIKKLFDEDLPEEFGIYVDLIGAVRYKLLKKKAKNGKNDELSNKYIYDAIIDSPVLEWIIEGSRQAKREAKGQVMRSSKTPKNSKAAKSASKSAKGSNSQFSMAAKRKINKFLKDLLGTGYTLSNLGIKF